MRIILVLTSLLVLAGCETMDLSSVTVTSGYSTYHPVHHSHIRYTLGYYSGSYYNGYRVYGTHGHRYYHAPRGYRHHRHYARPPVVVNRYYYTPPRRYTPPRHHDNRRHDRRHDNRRHDRRHDRQDDRNHRNDRREDRRDDNRRRDRNKKRK